MSFEITAKIDWGPLDKNFIQRNGLDKHGVAQTVLDTTIVRDCAKYCPFDTGTLSQSVRGIGTGLIEYYAPYAHYMYYGEVYGPNIPIKDHGEVVGFFSPPGQTKYPTGEKLQYSTEKNAMAGPFWFERAKADLKDKWLREVKAACQV